MRKIILLFIFLFCLGLISSAYYVTSPENCPVSYMSQTCSGVDHVCGYSGGVTYCYDPAGINPPAGSSSTTGSGGSDLTCEDTTCSGGYVIDCYYYDGTAPHCDNGNTGFIDRNPTCYNKHVQTTATGGSFITSTCSATCTTNYFACDGSTTDTDGCEIHAGDSCGSATGTIVLNQCYSASAGNCTSATRLDCDDSDSDGNPATCNAGNGCEILIWGPCTVGSLTGTYGSSCTGSSGTCVVTPQHFITATKTEGQSNATHGFLWGIDYFIGTLLNLSWSTGGGLYANSTGLYFNGSLLGGSAAETDPDWSGNYTAFNDSWSSITNSSYATHSNVIANSSPYQGYYNSTLINSTSLEDQSGKLGFVYTWFKFQVNNFIGNFTFYFNNNIAGNRTQIEGSITGNYTNMAATVNANYTSMAATVNANSTSLTTNFTRIEANINNNITAWNNQTNSSYVTVYGSNMTGNLNMTANITLSGTGWICNGTANCPAYIHHNGTGWIFRGILIFSFRRKKKKGAKFGHIVTKETRRKFFENYGYRTIFINEDDVLNNNWKEVCLNKIKG